MRVKLLFSLYLLIWGTILNPSRALAVIQRYGSGTAIRTTASCVTAYGNTTCTNIRDEYTSYCGGETCYRVGVDTSSYCESATGCSITYGTLQPTEDDCLTCDDTYICGSCTWNCGDNNTRWCENDCGDGYTDAWSCPCRECEDCTPACGQTYENYIGVGTLIFQ